MEGFVGQLAHDIRNGLNALELQLTYLREISTDPEAVDEIKGLRNTLTNVTRQLQSLRVATGVVSPYVLEYPATDFFDDLQQRFVKQHPQASGKVIWAVEPASEALLMVDPELTLNSLLELLTNALHFASPEATPIRVQVATIDQRTVFLLRELQTAPPTVTPAEWGRTPLLTTRRGAYGLGLFHARRCLEKQGGTLSVEYVINQNVLTTTVTLPGAPLTTP